jgi:membrane-associated phospholipid phosphatase
LKVAGQGAGAGWAAAMRPSERLTVLFLAALSATGALAGAVGGASAGSAVGPSLLGLAALLVAVLLLARSGAAGGPVGALRDFACVAVVLLTYLVLQPIIEVLNPARWDAVLAGLDARWAGPLVKAWRNALGRPAWLTDLAYAAYWSFYLLLISVAVAARWRRGPAALERVAFTLLLGFFLSYLGYLCWPTSGPRVPAAEEAAALGGGPLSEAVRAFLRRAEVTTLDAFPSGHTAHSLVALVLGARLFPRAAPALAAWAGLIVFATVYVSVHYLVDVAAGVLLAGLTLAVAPGLARRLGGWSATPDLDPDPAGPR